MKKYALMPILLILTLVLNGCGLLTPRTELNAEQFTARMKEAEFGVMDVSGQFDEGLVETVLVASIDGGYQIEFFALPDVEQAKTAFEQNKTDFEAIDESGGSTFTTSGVNFSTFSRTTDIGYYVVSRIESTFIYVNAPVEYKNDINKYLKILGY